MLASLRTHRPAAALLAVLMLFSGMMPLVQHACVMAAEHLRMHAADAQHALPGHHDMPGHHGMQADLPCHDRSAAPTPEHPAMAQCCVVEGSPALPAQNAYDAAAKRLQTLLPVLLFDALPAGDAAHASAASPFFDTGPPPAASVPLHLLHAVLLS